MNPQVRDRVILPVALPLGIVLFIGVVTFAMAWVLLNIPKKVAVSVGLMTAVSILAAASVIAVKSRLSRADLGLMLGVGAVPLIAGVGVVLGIVPVTDSEGHGPGEEEQTRVVTVVAQANDFDATELKVPAGHKFTLKLDNRDAVPHNISIHTERGGEHVFHEDPFPGPKTLSWEVGPLEARSYYFQCDVHPDMNGTIVAEEGEAAEKTEGPAASGTQKVTAKGNKFDKSELRFPSGQTVKLELNNLDVAPHNLTILQEAAGQPLFMEQPFGGPKKVVWDIPALPPGTYSFRCDVHPNMIGKVVVA